MEWVVCELTLGVLSMWIGYLMYVWCFSFNDLPQTTALLISAFPTVIINFFLSWWCFIYPPSPRIYLLIIIYTFKPSSLVYFLSIAKYIKKLRNRTSSTLDVYSCLCCSNWGTFKTNIECWILIKVAVRAIRPSEQLT